jgi:hypothetical protein
MKEKTYYYKRAFLNGGKEDTRPSVIVAKVSYEEWKPEISGYFNAHLEITGCNGTYVRFDLAIEDEEDISFDESIVKLQGLKSTIDDLRVAMWNARLDYDEMKQKQEQEQDKKKKS